MNPWIIITLVAAGVVYALDRLVRRTKWKDNSKTEKASLLLNMFSAGPYVFLSVLGLLWGIASGHPDSAVGQVLYDVTLTMGTLYFAVAAVAAISSLILRKLGKIKASIWVNIIALVYIVVVLGGNSLVGELL